MRLALISTLITLVVLGGCKPNHEADIPGTWKLSSGSATVTFKSDKTFSQDMSPGVTATGTWVVDNGDLVATPTMIAGEPIADFKKNLQAALTGRTMSKQAQDMIDDIDKPNVMTISDDGKTLTTDKARDTNSGPAQTLTKQ